MDNVRHIPVRAGSAIIFTEALMHGALPWKASHERRTLLYRYIPACMAYGRKYEPDEYESFADELGLSVTDAALGIIDITNNNMARSIRVVTVERGLDPRNFTLVPFGGAGPLMAAELADVLGIRRIVVPLAPGVTSGLGCLYVDITHDIGEALISELADADRARLQAVFDRLAETMRQRLTDDGVAAERQRLEYSIDLRYLGQVRALTVELETGEEVFEWWVLDGEGAPLARARTPVGLDVRLITDDMVWGLERDELDVEYIVRRRLMKDG